jgi:hypothetical protein
MMNLDRKKCYEFLEEWLLKSEADNQYFTALNTLYDTMPDLEKCEYCSHGVKFYAYGTEGGVPCKDCDGIGWVPRGK